MNILIAFNSFKHSMDAISLTNFFSNCLNNLNKEFIINKTPIADGGDSSAKIISKSLDLNEIKISVLDPLGRKILAPIYYKDNTAIIELADASGIKLLKRKEYNPLISNTYGTGELIKYAIETLKCSSIYLCVGGSATLDMGIGIAQALDCQFLNNKKENVNFNIHTIKTINDINISSKYNNIKFNILCDVDNTLLGKYGAAKVFGSQKGASFNQIELIEQAHTHLSNLINIKYHVASHKLKHGGASGGVPVLLKYLFNAKLNYGTHFIFNLLDIERKIKESDLIITGEGMLDSQSDYGKAPNEIAKLAQKHNKKVIAVCGNSEFIQHPLYNKVYRLVDYAISIQDSIQNPEKYLSSIAKKICEEIAPQI